MRELMVAGTQRREQFANDELCLNKLAAQDSLCYEQVYPGDGVPRHLVICLRVPKLMLSTYMRLWGVLDTNQSTSSGLMHYVEHLIHLIASKCDKSFSHDLDAFARPAFGMPQFFWTRAEYENDYHYECHCMNLVVRSLDAHQRFQTMFYFLALRTNARWTMSPRHFPMGLMNFAFSYLTNTFRCAIGNEFLNPIVPNANVSENAMLRAPTTVRQSVSVHLNKPLPSRLNACAFLDYFQNPTEIMFSKTDPDVDLPTWAKTVLGNECDMSYRVAMGTSTDIDLRVLQRSRVTMSQLQYETLCGIIGRAHTPNFQARENPSVLSLLLPPVGGGNAESSSSSSNNASSSARASASAQRVRANVSSLPAAAPARANPPQSVVIDDSSSESNSSVEEIPNYPSSQATRAQPQSHNAANPYTLPSAPPQSANTLRSRHDASVHAYRERRARELSSDTSRQIGFTNAASASASTEALQRPPKGQRTTGTAAAQRNFFV